MPDEIHVMPLRSGAWSVCAEPDGPPLSTHPEATEASRTALARARRWGTARVVLHDRYGRTRTTVARARQRS
jgi:hypothetical protein